jgi:hypothetical protein
MVSNWKNMEEQIDKARDRARHGDPREKRGEKRSWKEIDAKRDGAAHGAHRDEPAVSGGKAKDRYAEAQAEKAAMAQLDDLFRDKEADALRATVLAAEGRADLQEAVERWFEEKGQLPPDSELLDKCMDVRKDPTLRKVIASLDAAMSELDDPARKMLLRKAQTKGRRSFDAKLSREITALLEKHNFQDT